MHRPGQTDRRGRECFPPPSATRGGFVVGTAEYIIAGFLPQAASDLHVSPAAGTGEPRR